MSRAPLHWNGKKDGSDSNAQCSNLLELESPRINSSLANCSQRGLPIGPLHARPTYRSPGGSQESDSPIGEKQLKIRVLYTEVKDTLKWGRVCAALARQGW
jgi:hypothetical protein